MKPRLAKILLLMTTIATQGGHAEPATHSNTHSSGNVDPTAPIAALDKLTSLKTTAPLKVTLPHIIHFTTDSGTPVALVQTHHLPIVDVSVYFNAGAARDEAIKKAVLGLPV